MSKRYFINNLDTYLGQSIYRQLYNPELEEQENVIIATNTDPQNREKIPGVKKFLNRDKPKLFRKYLVESDVCIFDLHFGNIDEIKFAVDCFKAKAPFDEQKILILISSVLVWDGSPKKIKPPEEKPPEDQPEGEPEANKDSQPEATKTGGQTTLTNKEDDEDEDDDYPPKNKEPEPVVPVVEIQPEEEVEVIPEYVAFKETDYALRQPREQYQKLKDLEDLVLSLKIDNVKVFVICAGVLYGMGELAFKNMFRSAWLQAPENLPFIGDGENLVPTIHITDLAKLVLKVADSPPECPYVFGIDNTTDRRQKVLVESISKQVGTGHITSIPEADGEIIPKEFEDMFMINLEMIPSGLMVGTEEEPVEFDWTAQKGIPENIPGILKEFCSKESIRIMRLNNQLDLRPIKIMIKGCPKSEKTKYAKKLAKHYNVPHIKLKHILKLEEELPRPLKRHFKKEKEKILAYLDEGQERPLDPALKVLYRLIRWRLTQNDCRNRGFVLTGFPNHLDEVNYIFIKKNESIIYFLFELQEKLKRDKKKKKRKVIRTAPPGEENPAPQETAREGDDGTGTGTETNPKTTIEQPDTERDQKLTTIEEEQKDHKEPIVETKPETQPEEPVIEEDEGPPMDSSDSDLDDEEFEIVYDPNAPEGIMDEFGNEILPDEEEEAPPEEEEEEDDGQKGPKLELFFPDSLITFKKSPHKHLTTAEDRLKQEKWENIQKISKFYEFFRERNMDTYIFDHMNKDGEFGSFMSLLVFIEKVTEMKMKSSQQDGRPNNYLETFNDVAKEFFSKYTDVHQKYLQTLEAEKAQKEKADNAERDRRLNIAAEELKYLNFNEIPNPDEKNKPFRKRNYMMEYITPILGEGLLQISEILPDDPVDYLAEFLFKKSFEIGSHKQ